MRWNRPGKTPQGAPDQADEHVTPDIDDYNPTGPSPSPGPDTPWGEKAATPPQVKTDIPGLTDATIDAAFHDNRGVTYLLTHHRQQDISVRIDAARARTTMVWGPEDQTFKAINTGADETILPAAIFIRGVQYEAPPHIEGWDETRQDWENTIHTPLQEITPRTENPEDRRQIRVTVTIETIYRDHNHQVHTMRMTCPLNEAPRWVTQSTPTLNEDPQTETEIRNLLHIQLASRGLQELHIIETFKDWAIHRTQTIDYTSHSITPYTGNTEEPSHIWAAPTRIIEHQNLLDDDDELYYTIDWATPNGACRVGPATIDEHHTRLRDLGLHSLRADTFRKRITLLIRVLSRTTIIPREATTTKPCITHHPDHGYIIKPLPPRPTPREVDKALQVLEELAERFYRTPEQAHNYITILQYTLMMPYIWLAKTRLKTPRIYRYLYLHGEGATGKSILQRVMANLLPHDPGITTLIPAAGTDTAATLGELISSHGYGVMIEDVSGIFADEHLESMIKTATEHRIARRRNRRQADGVIREKSYHAMSPIVFSSNTPLRQDQPLLRRFYTLTFTEKPTPQDAAAYEKYLTTTDLTQLQALYQYSISWATTQDPDHIIEMLPHGRIIPEPNVATTILTEAYRYAGRPQPPWTITTFQPTFAEDEIEPVTVDALITYLRDTLARARNQEKRFLHTLNYEDPDEQAMYRMGSLDLIADYTEDVKTVTKRDGSEHIAIRSSIIPKLNMILQRNPATRPIRSLKELQEELQGEGVPVTEGRQAWGKQAPRVLEIPRGVVEDWLTDTE